MTNLRQVLTQFAEADVYGGQAEPSTVARPRRRSQRQLGNDLKDLRSRHDRRARIYLWVLVTTLAVLLILTIVNAGRPGTVAALFAAANVTVGMVLVMLNRLWKELYRIDVFLVLLGRLSDQKLEEVCLAFLHGSFKDLEQETVPASPVAGVGANAG